MGTIINELPGSVYGDGRGPGSETKHFYRRDLLLHDDRCLIQSTCRNCGAVIVGSVAETLVDDEQRHFQRCSTTGRMAAG